MRARTFVEVEMDRETREKLAAMGVPNSEGVRRAVALYACLENPDEVLDDEGVLGGDGGE